MGRSFNDDGRREGAGGLTHLQRLEAESMHIMREVAAEAENPVMLYSIGKDSAVMLHLAMKAFYPSLPPFPLLHVDTTWKFREMIEFRDDMVAKLGLKLLVHTNQEGVAPRHRPLHARLGGPHRCHEDRSAEAGARPVQVRCRLWRRAARRGEIPRQGAHLLVPHDRPPVGPQEPAPELWNLYNARKTKGESIRVFPIRNWTELDIWQYIHLEKHRDRPALFRAPRPVVSGRS